MHFFDLARMAMSNLWRTKVRTTFTVLGVIIGVGALTSMVSFGVGMQKNVTDAFVESDLFTSLTITSAKIDIDKITSGDIQSLTTKQPDKQQVLNDSLIAEIKKVEGISVAFPEISIPVRLDYNDQSTTLSVRAIPVDMKAYYPFNKVAHGRFFTDNKSREIVLDEKVLKRLGVKIKNGQNKIADTTNKYKYCFADSILGTELDLLSKNIDIKQVVSNPFAMMMGKKNLPFKDSLVKLRIAGILSKSSDFSANDFGSGAYIPIETSELIPSLGFSSVWDLLKEKDSNSEGYSSIYVRVENVEDMTRVIKELRAMNLNVFAFSEKLKEIKRIFIILNSLLSVIGLIALVVAAFGIINTMLMSILERTREIGIMKSIGGGEGDIRKIFFVEVSFIGLIGGLFGIVLGWLVTKLAGVILNAQLAADDLPDAELFYFPLWLIFGAIGFSIFVSLAAGMYPANKAARIDPVKALRHD